MALADAQRFFDQDDTVSAHRGARRRRLRRARDRARASSRPLGGFPYRARDWMEVNRNLFSALKLEKVVYGIVLALIVVVAAFNILASLTMVVKEKRRDIAILKSMGASSAAIGAHLHPERRGDRGGRHAPRATLLGLAGCWLLARYQFVELPKDVFLVDHPAGARSTP